MVAVVLCAALFSRAACWAGLSLASSPPLRNGLGWGAAGLATAGTVCMPTASNAAVATSAPAAAA